MESKLVLKSRNRPGCAICGIDEFSDETEWEKTDANEFRPTAHSSIGDFVQITARLVVYSRDLPESNHQTTVFVR